MGTVPFVAKSTKRFQRDLVSFLRIDIPSPKFRYEGIVTRIHRPLALSICYFLFQETLLFLRFVEFARQLPFPFPQFHTVRITKNSDWSHECVAPSFLVWRAGTRLTI